MTTPQPHDRLTRWALSQPAVAASWLASALPAPVAAAVDWASLADASAELVDEKLDIQIPDLLFRARLHGDGEALLRVLIEHQSSAEPLIALKLAGEVVRLLERERRDRPSGPLPWIIPVVLAHGPEPWRAAEDLGALLAVPDPLRGDRLVQRCRYVLYDLRALSDEQLRGSALAILALRLLKHARDGDLWDRLTQWTDVVHAVVTENGPGAIEAALRYILEVNPTGPSAHARRWIAATLGPEEVEMVKGWAQQLEEKGEARGLRRGLQQGMQQGMQQGVHRGRAEFLARVAAQRFGPLSPEQAARIEVASDDDLARWIDALLVAPSLDDLFNG